MWKKSRVLARSVYDMVQRPVYDNDKNLRHQMLKSSGSIMDNIAEGQARGGDKEFRQFLWISRGSSAELRSQLYRSFDRGFVTKEMFDDLFQQAEEIEKMLRGLINHLEISSFKGIKYK